MDLEEKKEKIFDLYKWNLSQVFLPSANANYRKLYVNYREFIPQAVAIYENSRSIHGNFR